jgi:hypothetical protein
MNATIKTTGQNLGEVEIEIIHKFALHEAEETGKYNRSAALRKIIRQWAKWNGVLREEQDGHTSSRV